MSFGEISLTGTFGEGLIWEVKARFTLTNYFFPGLNTGSKNNFFEWRKDKTGHILEGTLAFNGSDRISFYYLKAAQLVPGSAAWQFSTWVYQSLGQPPLQPSQQLSTPPHHTSSV
ncbi:MAG: hypothetical protein PHH93_03790, partial [Prolixibacteraceae bacterium]|nr:hypothetical protein [Prolixibacteraceae bacterium]